MTVVGEERRQAARVLLVDEDGAVLLFRGVETSLPVAQPWWFPPGGGLKAGESFEDAARRELREETGYEATDIGPAVLRHDFDYSFVDSVLKTHEALFVVQAKRFEVETTGLTRRERSYIIGHRWWTRDALRATSDAFYPDNLVSIIDAHLA